MIVTVAVQDGGSTGGENGGGYSDSGFDDKLSFYVPGTLDTNPGVILSRQLEIKITYVRAATPVVITRLLNVRRIFAYDVSGFAHTLCT